MMDNKHKLVIISDSGLQQRQFDYYYVDTLNEKFDFEYWNCSKLLLKKINRVATKIQRPYIHNIDSLWQLRQNLKYLPHDTLIIHSTVSDKRSYVFNKMVSSYFKHRIVVGVSLPITLPVSEVLLEENHNTNYAHKKIGLLKKIKRRFFRLGWVKLGIQLLHQPSQSDYLINNYYDEKIRSMYEWHLMSCLPGAKYYINASNVEKYMKSKSDETKTNERYIVYIDSFFPYHKELRFDIFPLNVESIARSHFAKINQFFDKIEKEYNCPVVIAAHPLANYAKNPYNGREIRHGETDVLIGKSEAVIMHTSGSISYAILYDKPTALLMDEEWRHCNWAQKIFDQNEYNGIEIIDIDKDDAEPIIKPLPKGLREAYLKAFVGDTNPKNFKYNDELIVNNLNEIYKEIYL